MPGSLRLTTEILISVDGDCFPGGQEIYVFFNFDIVKTSEGETEGQISFFL